MKHARNSTRARRICFDAHKWVNPLSGRTMLTCHVCKTWIDVLKDPTAWRADHIRRHAEGGEDTPENLFPICLDCDTGEDGKAAQDTRDVAHGKRASNKHFGIERKRPWR